MTTNGPSAQFAMTKLNTPGVKALIWNQSNLYCEWVECAKKMINMKINIKMVGRLTRNIKMVGRLTRIEQASAVSATLKTLLLVQLQWVGFAFVKL